MTSLKKVIEGGSLAEAENELDTLYEVQHANLWVAAPPTTHKARDIFSGESNEFMLFWSSL